MNGMHENSMKNASHTVDEAKAAAGKTAHRAHSVVVDGLHATASALTALRGVALADALRSVLLPRRRGSATAIVSFGSGFLAGAASGVLFAPQSGANMRRAILDWFTNVGRDGKTEDAAARGEQRTPGKPAEGVDQGENGQQRNEATNPAPNGQRTG